MRINSIQGIRYNPSFNGRSMIKYIHFDDERDVRTTPNEDDFPEYSFREVVPGNVPMERIKTTYKPDIIMKCRYYYADDYEYTGDYHKRRYSAVVADRNRTQITEEQVGNEKKYYSSTDINDMRKTLRKDLEDSMAVEDSATTLDVVAKEREKQEEYKRLLKIADDTIDRQISEVRRHDPTYLPDFMKEEQGKN